MIATHSFQTQVPSANQRHSSPSSNSMSSATPPQQNSRASPASTALVMSTNNIAQPQGWQITPKSLSNGDFCASSSSAAAAAASNFNINNNNTLSTNMHSPNSHFSTASHQQQQHYHQQHPHQHQQRHHNQSQQAHHHQQQQQQQHQYHQQLQHHHHQQQQQQHHQLSQQQHHHHQQPRHQPSRSSASAHTTANNASQPPHPMMRQLVCHTKSMSAGVVVSVPGISSSLATTIQAMNNNSTNEVVNAYNQSANYHRKASVGHLSQNYFDARNQQNLNLASAKVNELTSSNSFTIPEFLPISELMFYLISMILYFCENVFGIIAVVALYLHSGNKYWSLLGAVFVFATNCICQYVSFKWLFRSKLEECRNKRRAREELEDEESRERSYRIASIEKQSCGSFAWVSDSAAEVHFKFFGSILIDALYHILCLGFLIRYIKLVVPIADKTLVQKEASELCMLRIIHGFCQSAPLLLIQSYVIASQTTPTPLTNLSTVSTLLSLISVCWAMASFTKHARKKYDNRFEFSWPGLTCKLLWRFGTILSRVVALTIYAVYYSYWMVVVLSLHWVTMFLWLINKGDLLKDENVPNSKRFSLAAALGWIYCFCYLNFEDSNSKIKIISYYLIQFLENNLLLTVCLIFSNQVSWFKNVSILVIYMGFVTGIIFMSLYYRYFHISMINDEYSLSNDSIDSSLADKLTPAGKKIAGYKASTLRLKSDENLVSSRNYSTSVSTIARQHHEMSSKTLKSNFEPRDFERDLDSFRHSSLFDCQFEEDLKRRKKIKTLNRH